MQALEYVAPFLTMLIGVWIGNKLSLRRQKKAELQNEKNMLFDDFERLSELAIAYHTNPVQDHSLEQRISIALDVLDARAENLERMTNQEFDFWKVRIAITLLNFETAQFMQQTHDSAIITHIKKSFKECIEMLKQKT